MKTKKNFKDLTTAEIRAMSEEEFLAVSPFEKQSCADCKHLRGYVSLWCINKEAREYRGTGIPGVIKCHFWGPCWKRMPKKYRTKENGYKGIISILNV